MTPQSPKFLRSIDANAPLNYPLVIASDIHLRQPDDERATLLMAIMERLGPEVEYLVLNGDIFDFCFGGGRYFRDKFQLLGQAMAKVAGRGTRVLFLEGNHEFHLGEVGWPAVEIITDRDYHLTLQSGVRVKITHGDQLTGERLYAWFRFVIKSRLLAWLVRLVPGAWLDSFALGHARRSRARDRYRRLDHGRILSAFDHWLAEGGCEHGVIGHFHVPYAEPRPAGTGLMLSVESWDRPNLLVYGDAGFQRLFFDPRDGSAQVAKVEPIFKSFGGVKN